MNQRFLIVIFTLLVFLMLPATAGAGEPLSPRVDERAELVGVVFHLAGLDEYNEIKLEDYNRDITSYFKPFKEHPAVLEARQLHLKRGVGYNAPMALALDLSSPPSLLPPLVPFSDTVPEYRFGKVAATDFARKLEAFYRDAKFAEFFKNHLQLYRDQESATAELLKGFDLDWFPKFFSYDDKINFRLIVSLTNGNSNFGVTNCFPDGHHDVYSVNGCVSPDERNRATSGPHLRSIVAHEFSHAFVNPFVDRNFQEFESAASEMFKYVGKQMSNDAYPSPKIMMYESLTRACQCLYDQSHEGQDKILKRIREEQGNGFFWMDELYPLLSKYNTGRDKYPNLQSFVPELKKFFQDYAANMKDKMAAYKSHCPHVSTLTPALNHEVGVSTGLKELVVTFDQPLQPPYMSVCTVSEKGVEFPELNGMPVFQSDNKQILLRFKQLAPERKYKILFSSMSFRNKEGYRLEDYEIEFTTGK